MGLNFESSEIPGRSGGFRLGSGTLRHVDSRSFELKVSIAETLRSSIVIVDLGNFKIGSKKSINVLPLPRAATPRWDRPLMPPQSAITDRSGRKQF